MVFSRRVVVLLVLVVVAASLGVATHLRDGQREAAIPAASVTTPWSQPTAPQLGVALAQQSQVASAGPWYGVLQTSGRYTQQELANRQTVGTLELGWDRYEPANGAFSATYIATQKSKLAAMRSAGMRVILDAGLHYPPAWVFGLDANTRFVDQYGDVYSSSTPGFNPANAVFNQRVRAAQAVYIARIYRDFGDAFFAIRVGGLATGELRYPGSSFAGHRNTYWAFDANAQAASPVKGWKPGQRCTAAQVRAFLVYYFASLQSYQSWQIATWRARWPSTTLQVLYPSWGMRPGDATTVETTCANGSSSTEINGNPQMGLDWEHQVASIKDVNVTVYTTWLETADQGTSHRSESPVRYLVYLAGLNPVHPAVAGETSGNNTYAQMQRSVDRVKRLHLAGMLWAFEGQLAAMTPARTTTSFVGYGYVIATYP